MNAAGTEINASGLDFDALLTLNYGLYVVSSHCDGGFNGQISNAVMQITDKPVRLATAVNKKAMTHEFISASGALTVTVLAESAPMKLIGLFGFHSGRDIDKFSQVAHSVGATGCPIVDEHSLACMDVRVESTLDCESHSVFIGEVVDARILGQGRPMTYAYYREVLGGKTPPTAPTYRPSEPSNKAQKKTKESPEMEKYICDVCGYVYDPAVGDPDNGIEAGTSFADLPEGWVCPECGVGKDEFSPAE